MLPHAHASRGRCCLSVRSLVAWLWVGCLLWAGTTFLHASELQVVPTAPLPAPADSPLRTLVAAYKGQPVIINFWASWCEPCRDEMPSLQRLTSRRRDQGLVVITVAVADQIGQVQKFLAENSLQFAAINDREKSISQAWDARVLPTSIVLDRRHRIRLRAQGPIDWDSPATDNALQSLLR